MLQFDIDYVPRRNYGKYEWINRIHVSYPRAISILKIKLFENNTYTCIREKEEVISKYYYIFHIDVDSFLVVNI